MSERGMHGLHMTERDQCQFLMEIVDEPAVKAGGHAFAVMMGLLAACSLQHHFCLRRLISKPGCIKCQ